jgi:hypothetical protein
MDNCSIIVIVYYKKVMSRVQTSLNGYVGSGDSGPVPSLPRHGTEEMT